MDRSDSACRPRQLLPSGIGISAFMSAFSASRQRIVAAGHSAAAVVAATRVPRGAFTTRLICRTISMFESLRRTTPAPGWRPGVQRLSLIG